jgi:hypothetical protein
MVSTALVPAGMYDSQALDVLRQLAGYPPVKTLDRGAAVRAIKRTIQGICIEGALSVLDAFGYRDTDFHYMKNRWIVADLADERYFPDCQGRMAHETPVFWFWGGPPNRLKWYEGTLQTLLEDRILCEIEVRGVEEVAKWIGTDLTEAMQ